MGTKTIKVCIRAVGQTTEMDMEMTEEELAFFKKLSGDSTRNSFDDQPYIIGRYSDGRIVEFG